MKKNYHLRVQSHPTLKKLIMELKIVILIVLVSVSNIFASNSYSQTAKVTLDMENKTLEQVMDEIEQQSEFYFIFNQKQVDVERVINIKAEDRLIGDILPELFFGTKINYAILEKKILLTTDPLKDEINSDISVYQQNVVSGTVTDALTGERMPGVNIVVKGTTIGTITDAAGNYSITVPDRNAALVFSFIGNITQEIPLNGRTTLDVALVGEVTGLDEVVVIGYGTQRKKDLTGSVVRADIESFREQSKVSVIESLHGSVPGVNVGQVTTAGEAPNISIRGRNTISGTTSPLIVLDGIIYRGNMVDINPNDIESIDILKDASATAIYGSQASNGVIMISSKKGQDLGKTVVSYSGSYSYQLPSNLVKMNNSEEFIYKLKQIYLTKAYLAPDYIEENPAFNVSNVLPDKSTVDGYAAGIDTDWWNLLTNAHGTIQNHSLSIRGKSNAANYFFSVGGLDQDNIIINDTYKRYNVRLNLESIVTKWMKLGIQSFLTSSDFSGSSPSMGTVQNLPPVCSPYDANGNLLEYAYKTNINPLLTIQNDDLEKRVNLFGNFYADVTIPFIEGLNYRVNYSQNAIVGRDFNFDKTAMSFQGAGTKNNSFSSIRSFDNILTYKRAFGIHSLNMTLVYGTEYREGEDTGASGNIFQNDALGFNKLQSGQADQNQISSSAYEERSLYSMGRLFYGYRDKYLFTVTLRRDGFSGFGENNKVGYFPSYAFGWIASEESFLKDYEWLNQLKLRLSYGTNGNRTIGRYATLAQVSSATRYLYGDGASAEIAQWVSSLANPDLKWEKTTTSNIGIDFSLLNNRLSGYIESYIGNTKDLLYQIEIPVVNGFGSIMTNIGKMRNRGIEFSVYGNPIKEQNFSWDVRLNFSLNRNEVISIKGTDVDGDGNEDNIISSNPGNSIFMGEPYGIWYDYDIIGMWQIADGDNIPSGFTFGTYKIRDISGEDGIPDGKWTAAHDRTIVGYKDPAYQFSILNSFNYKNFELKFFINSVQGGKDYYKAVAAGNWANIDNLKQNNSSSWDWWTPENKDAKFRRIGNAPQSVGESVHPYSSRSFVRLQDISLSYQFQPIFLKKYGISFLKLYVTGKNLKTWTNWEGWDPETGRALTAGAYPVLKSYSFGLDVEF